MIPSFDPEKLAPMPLVPALRPIVLWGKNRHTAVAALALARKRAGEVFVAADSSSGQQWLGHPIMDSKSVPQDADVLYSWTEICPQLPNPCFPIALDLTNADRLTDELNRLSATDLHNVQAQLQHWSFLREASFIHNFIFYRFNCRIPPTAVIGTGTSLAYGGIGVVIHKDARIGDNVKIGQNVTLGARAGGNGPPAVGNDVFIGPNSVCLGGSIGDGAVIGAGSVVLKPVGAGVVVAGNPARPLRSAREE